MRTQTGWTQESLNALLDSNESAVKRALLVIYARQTDDERSSELTRHHNMKGFTGSDAPLLSSFAKQLQTRGFLSQKQINITRRRIKKYWRQLLEEIELKAERGEKVSPPRQMSQAPAPEKPTPVQHEIPMDQVPVQAPVQNSIAGSW